MTPDAPTPEPLSLLTSSFTNPGEEEVQHSAQPGGVSAAGFAKDEEEALPMQISSGLMSVPVYVSVQDNPVSASVAAPASTAISPGRSSLPQHTVRDGSLRLQRQSATHSQLQELRDQFLRNQAETAHCQLSLDLIPKSAEGAASQLSGEE